MTSELRNFVTIETLILISLPTIIILLIDISSVFSLLLYQYLNTSHLKLKEDAI